MMVQKRNATLGDLVFGDVDPYGTAVYLADIKGWENGTGTTGTFQQRAADDGAWLDPAYRPPRLIELTLTLVGTSFLNVSKSIRRIANGLPLSMLDTLIVDNHGEVLSAQVRQGGDVIDTQKGNKGTVSLALLAPDPRRYSTEEISASTGLPLTTGGLSLPLELPLTIGATTTSGVLALDNPGDQPSPVVFTITGPCPAGATITHRGTGAQLRYPDALAAGHELVIDTGAHTAILDGTAPRTVIGTWFSLAPGANEIGFSASSYDPDALLTATYRPAWR